MKKTNLAEVKKTEVSQIRSKLKHIMLETQKMKLDKAVNKLTDLKSISKRRKDIAQMFTILRQKELLAKLEEPNGK